MSFQKNSLRPDVLYRGIVIPHATMTADVITRDHEPRGVPLLDAAGNPMHANGRVLDSDGNELAVYMTTNQRMARTVYATPDHTDPMQDSPVFTYRDSRCTLGSARIGVLYRISTKELDIRPPHIGDTLSGVYNNGFEGDEWVADAIPRANLFPEELIIGEDLLHPGESILIGEGIDHAVANVDSVLTQRMARLQRAADALRELPIHQLDNGYKVASILNPHIQD